MKESFIKENVMQVEKKLFPFILQIKIIKCTIKIFGGVIRGRPSVIEENLILVKVFSSNLMNLTSKFQNLQLFEQTTKIQVIVIFRLIIKIVI